NEVEDLKKKYCFSEFFEKNWHKTLLLNFADLTKNNEINENDSLEILVKKMHQVGESEGYERLNKFNIFWKDFLEIAKKYRNDLNINKINLVI
ncbi:MAG: hypothetical protein PHN56_01505, partial [Candidatus Nanoarchaeia archaeon]|nr:hypothetical protein [Candidatus Nanoarchaeia archaeon]